MDIGVTESDNEDPQFILARPDRLVTENIGQEADVLRLMFGDLHKSTTHPGREAGLLEVFLAELGESASVERVLKVLQGEGKVEHLRICRNHRQNMIYTDIVCGL